MFTNSVKIPEGVEARKQDHKIMAKGPEGENSREFRHPKIEIEVKEGEILLKTDMKGKNDGEHFFFPFKEFV